jgi:phage terminase small subunit
MSKPNLKWNLFAKELIKCQFNASKAYMAAYPDATYESARREASRLLTNVDFQKVLDSELAMINVAEIVNQRKIILNLLEDRELARQKEDISTMARCDELLGKCCAIFTDRQKIENSIEFTASEKEEVNRIKKRLGISNN